MLELEPSWTQMWSPQQQPRSNIFHSLIFLIHSLRLLHTKVNHILMLTESLLQSQVMEYVTDPGLLRVHLGESVDDQDDQRNIVTTIYW